ncbi:bestrophin family protein [Persicitalea sp.]|uniref:bestrophin family protein n=1 Tax=Persicitalea sp. TaxID=3100273 RepID=UPI003593AA70
MLISKNVRIGRIISGTGRYAAFDLFICVAAFFISDYVVSRYFAFPAIIPTILGTALAFFVGFNNNQSYDRWWEARKIWGALVNDSRTWARQIIYNTSASDNIPEQELNILRRVAIWRHIAFLYALKKNLRKSVTKEHAKFLSLEEFTDVERAMNVPNAILSHQSELVEDLYKRKAIDGFRFMEMNRMIVNFCDEMGKSERIANTVFPTTYNYYTRAFIWIFTVSTTMVTANAIGYWSILFGTLVGYIFLTTHSVGQALVDPFEPLPTGIPLDQITRTIEINLLEMLGEEDIPEPIQSVDGEYIL